MATPGMMATNRPITPSGKTAKTMILVGLILQALGVLIAVVTIAALAFFAVGIFGSFAFLGLGLGILLLFLVYYFSYRRTAEGNYEGARTPTIIWAVLSIISIYGILPGIFFLIAYVKLGDAVREQQQNMQQMQQMQYAQPAWGAPPPAQPGYAAPAPAAPGYAAPMAAAPAAGAATGTPTCPRCGQPATWIAQYSRWYCPRDQTYL